MQWRGFALYGKTRRPTRRRPNIAARPAPSATNYPDSGTRIPGRLVYMNK
ncbi:hypothetical protein Hsw_1738 [Hymenobacter swuensis DY53]|uniref:Uncharacterized protein n=1 Tax=Hymenobacter swuensis DY53 TaxID=1227739 RepID=W8EXM5_9BACT|nr:hypothetical protein Hsw_1738 [Hymenobacter swuensis DY53]